MYSDPEAQTGPEGDRVKIKPGGEIPRLITSEFTGKMFQDEASSTVLSTPNEMRSLATLCPLCFLGIIL